MQRFLKRMILLDIFSGLNRHVVSQALDHVVILQGLLYHLHPLPPHGQHRLKWVQLSNLTQINKYSLLIPHPIPSPYSDSP